MEQFQSAPVISQLPKISDNKIAWKLGFGVWLNQFLFLILWFVYAGFFLVIFQWASQEIGVLISLIFPFLVLAPLTLWASFVGLKNHYKKRFDFDFNIIIANKASLYYVLLYSVALILAKLTSNLNLLILILLLLFSSSFNYLILRLLIKKQISVSGADLNKDKNISQLGPININQVGSPNKKHIPGWLKIGGLIIIAVIGFKLIQPYFFQNIGSVSALKEITLSPSPPPIPPPIRLADYNFEAITWFEYTNGDEASRIFREHIPDLPDEYKYFTVLQENGNKYLIFSMTSIPSITNAPRYHVESIYLLDNRSSIDRLVMDGILKPVVKVNNLRLGIRDSKESDLECFQAPNDIYCVFRNLNSLNNTKFTLFKLENNNFIKIDIFKYNKIQYVFYVKNYIYFNDFALADQTDLYFIKNDKVEEVILGDSADFFFDVLYIDKRNNLYVHAFLKNRPWVLLVIQDGKIIGKISDDRAMASSTLIYRMYSDDSGTYISVKKRDGSTEDFKINI